MSYNGSGTFNINSSGQPVVTGTVISSTAFNALTADLGTGLSTAITKDGQTVATARIPFAAGINSSLVTDATNTTTGSIITAGGVGIAKALFVGTTLNVAGASTLAAITGTFNGTVGATTPATGAFTTLSATNGTFSGYLTGTGTNPGGLGGSRYVLDFSTGQTRVFSYGANASTNGGFLFNSQRSDGSNSTNFLDISSAGAVTIPGTLAAGATTVTGTLSATASAVIGTDSGTIDTQTLTLRRGLGSGNQFATLVANGSGLSISGSSGQTTVQSVAAFTSTGLAVTGTVTATNSAATTVVYMQNTNATTAYGMQIYYSGRNPNNTAEEFIYCGDASLRFSVRSNGGIANYSGNNVNLSDRIEKTNFAPATSYLDKICAIPVQTFNYIDQNLEEDNGLTLGVVAQDVQAVAPELVMESNWAGKDEEPKMRLSIYQTDLQYALMKCIQEQQALITALTTRITALEAK